MTRKALIVLPDKYCNTCQFYKSWNPDPELCTGFGGFRRYHCELFNARLQIDMNLVHKQPRDVFDTKEYKALVSDQCKRKYP